MAVTISMNTMSGVNLHRENRALSSEKGGAKRRCTFQVTKNSNKAGKMFSGRCSGFGSKKSDFFSNVMTNREEVNEATKERLIKFDGCAGRGGGQGGRVKISQMMRVLRMQGYCPCQTR